MIHPETHFTDEKAGPLRAETYHRLRRHWQFINELKLFDEIQNQRRYGINVYGAANDPSFVQAASLYHPDTVIRSFSHDGSGDEPGIKDPDGNWDIRPHKGRLVTVDAKTLATWAEMLEDPETPVLQTRMVYAVNRATADVLDKLSAAPRMSQLNLQFSRGWDESIDRKKGFFDSEWGVPESWDDVILQGSHLSVARPMFKYPNPTMLHNTDWTEQDIEAFSPDEVPATSYKPRGDRAKYDAAYTHWDVIDTKYQGSGSGVAARSTYRLAWRNMAANTGERTFIPALIPPGTAHIHGVSSVGGLGGTRSTVLASGFAASLLHDFAVRAAPKSTISATTLGRLPFIDDPTFSTAISLRTLRLNCVSRAYSDVWSENYAKSFSADTWTRDLVGLGQLEHIEPQWTAATPLRGAVERRQALLEVDVLVAMTLGITADELCTIYRTQFPVLYGYDTSRDLYDASGRVVPNLVVVAWRRAGGNDGHVESDILRLAHPGSGIEYEYRLPFAHLDREVDFRLAFAEFGRRFGVTP